VIDPKDVVDVTVEIRHELGSFNISGKTIPECIRAMRLQLEKYQGMIDDLVREIVKAE